MRLTGKATQSSSSARGDSEQKVPSVRNGGRGGGGNRNSGGGPGHSGHSVLSSVSSSSILLHFSVLKNRTDRRLISPTRDSLIFGDARGGPWPFRDRRIENRLVPRKSTDLQAAFVIIDPTARGRGEGMVVRGKANAHCTGHSGGRGTVSRRSDQKTRRRNKGGTLPSPRPPRRGGSAVTSTGAARFDGHAHDGASVGMGVNPRPTYHAPLPPPRMPVVVENGARVGEGINADRTCAARGV